MSDIQQYLQAMVKHDLLTKEEVNTIAKRMSDSFDTMVDTLLDSPLAWQSIWRRWNQLKDEGKSSSKMAEEYGNPRVTAADLIKAIDSNIEQSKRRYTRWFRGSQPRHIRNRIKNNFKDAALSKDLYLEVVEEVLKDKRLPQRIKFRVTTLRQDIIDGRNQLVQSNLKMVIRFAREYNNRGVPFEDLIQDGNVGLIRAAEKFDYKKNLRFSTYAAWWIRQGFLKAIHRNSNVIRLPSHVQITISKLIKLREEMTVDMGREPSIYELAKEIDLDPVIVNRLLDFGATLSLDVKVRNQGEGRTLFLKDMIPDEGEGVEVNFDELLLPTAIKKTIDSCLTTVEKNVIVSRYGLDGKESKTLEEIANNLGRSRERIRQIETIAIHKLRANGKSLKEFV